MVDSLDCCDLAAHILGIKEYEDEEQVWVELWDQHEIDEDGFSWLINELLPMINIGESCLTNSLNVGFSQDLGNKISEFFVKQPMKAQDVFKKNIAFKWVFEQMKDCKKGFKMDVTGPEGKVKLTVEKVE